MSETNDVLGEQSISLLSRTMSVQYESMFDDPDIFAELAELDFVAVAADKASNTIILCMFAKRII